MTSSNPLSGLSGRAALLKRLGSTLEESPTVFSKNGLFRPGYMLGIFIPRIYLTPDYILSHESTSTVDGKPVVLLPTLWDVLTINLRSIWPEGRTKFTEGGRGLGDVWKISTLDSLDDGISHHLIPPDSRSQIPRTIPQTHSMALLLAPPSLQICQHHNRRRTSPHCPSRISQR